MQPTNGQKNQLQRILEALEEQNPTIIILNFENVSVNQVVDARTNQNVSSGIMIGSAISRGTISNTTEPKSENGGLAKTFETAGKFMEMVGKASPIILILAITVSICVGNSKVTNCLTQVSKIVMKE